MRNTVKRFTCYTCIVVDDRIDSFTVRALQCKSCGKKVFDSDRFGSFKYKVMEKSDDLCSVDGCENKKHAKGMCKKHYDRARR